MTTNIYLAILDYWVIPPALKDRLDKYYLLHWEKDYFFNQSLTGRIVHQDVEYLVLYHQCLPLHMTRADVKQVALSFRKLASMPYGYVLVKPINQSGE